jgi:hypothetical protein
MDVAIRPVIPPIGKWLVDTDDRQHVKIDLFQLRHERRLDE